MSATRCGATLPASTACHTAQPGSRSWRQSRKRQWPSSGRISTNASSMDSGATCASPNTLRPGESTIQPPPSLSGTMYAWDILSDHDQAIASGLYLYSVENLATGKRQIGKFAVIKSDAEN